MNKIEKIEKLLKENKSTVNFAKNMQMGKVNKLLLKIVKIVENRGGLK